MDLVCIHPWGSPATIHRTLTSAEREALLESRCAPDDPREAQQLLGAIWQARLWVACDCHSRSKGEPTFFVRRTPRGRFQLWPMADRAAHAAGCAFSTSREDILGEGADRLPYLAHVLCRWMGAARLNHLFPYPGSDLLHLQYENLREASKSLELSPGRNLYKYSRAHRAGLPALVKRVLETRADVQPDMFPHAVYWTCVNNLSHEDLEESLEGAGEVLLRSTGDLAAQTVTLPEAAEVEGAHVVLFALRAHASSPHVYLDRLFAHPVLIRVEMVPIGSRQERDTLPILSRVQREAFRSHGILLSIRKTLPDSSLYERGIAFQFFLIGPNGTPVRSLDIVSVQGDPDFSGSAASAVAVELDWRHEKALREALRQQGVIYHFATRRAAVRAGDRLEEDLMDWVLSRPGGASGSGNGQSRLAVV